MLYWLAPVALVAGIDLVLTTRLFGISAGDQVVALLPGIAAAALLITLVTAARSVCAHLQAGPLASLVVEAVIAGGICAVCLATVTGVRRPASIAHALPRA